MPRETSSPEYHFHLSQRPTGVVHTTSAHTVTAVLPFAGPLRLVTQSARRNLRTRSLLLLATLAGLGPRRFACLAPPALAAMRPRKAAAAFLAAAGLQSPHHGVRQETSCAFLEGVAWPSLQEPRIRWSSACQFRDAGGSMGRSPRYGHSQHHATMQRLRQILLIGTLLPLCWLLMQAVHELGHVAAAIATGGTVSTVVLHPLTISRTDVAENPHPLLVVWAGPFVGVLLPAVAYAVSQAARFRGAFLVRFFAGFCLDSQRGVHRGRVVRRDRRLRRDASPGNAGVVHVAVRCGGDRSRPRLVEWSRPGVRDREGRTGGGPRCRGTRRLACS